MPSITTEHSNYARPFSQLYRDYSHAMCTIPLTIPEDDEPEVFLEKHGQRLKALRADFEGDFESGKLTLLEFLRLCALADCLA